MIFGETNLLQSQLNLLTILKQYQAYEALRKEELFFKIELKKKLGEAKEFLDSLSKSLPESKFLEEQKKKEKIQKEFIEKVEAVVQISKNKESKYWKEKEPKAIKPAPEKVEESEKPEHIESSSLDQELEEIRKKLEKLQQV